MANAIRGCLGLIQVQDAASATGVVTLGGLQEWSLSEESETIDASEIGTCSKASIAGATTRTMSLSGFFDEDDAGQAATIMAVGNVIDVHLYPGGNSSGEWYFKTATGDGATITSIEKSGGVDSLVTFSASLEINGTPTTGSVT